MGVKGLCKISHSAPVIVKFTTNNDTMEPNAPDTSNFLNWVEIKNFKSIKDLRLDCKRVNVFIGKPNVGKSNILEALGLLGVRGTGTRQYMDGSIRYETLDQLFYDGNSEDKIYVNTNLIEASLEFEYNPTLLDSNLFLSNWTIKRSILHSYGGLNRGVSIRKNGEIFSESAGTFSRREERDPFDSMVDGPVKKYDFAGLTKFDNLFSGYLAPPSGDNLYAVVNRKVELWNEFAELFSKQNLEFILADSDKNFILQKRDGPRAKQYKFFSIADTFQRFMFYIAAIESNENSVLIFEEPEVHSFPPYTQDVAYRMIYSTDNQFFVSTHSPYLLQTLVENLGDDQLSVFVTYYENYETKVKALTPEELSFVQEYSTDVFFNLDRFIPNAHPTSAV